MSIIEPESDMEDRESAPPQETSSPWTGTILEAAFVDPAYSWPPNEGEGSNAVELEASTVLLANAEDKADLQYPLVPKIKGKKKVVTETETITVARCGIFKCCKSEEQVVRTHTQAIPVDPNEKERLKREYVAKREAVRRKRKEHRSYQEKYARVPDGVLIYRLDTAARTVSLISAPNSNTDLRALMTDIVVTDAQPSKSSSRRGILLTDEVGSRYELVACEQRSATSWMEALNMMLGKGRGNKLGRVSGQNCWRYIFGYFNQLTIFVSFDSFLVEEIAIPMPTIRVHLKSNTLTLLPTLTISSVPARFHRKRIRRRLLVAFIIVSRRSTKRVMKLMTKRLKVSQSVVQLLRIHGISTV